MFNSAAGVVAGGASGGIAGGEEHPPNKKTTTKIKHAMNFLSIYVAPHFALQKNPTPNQHFSL